MKFLLRASLILAAFGLISCDVPLDQFYAGKLDSAGKYDLKAFALDHTPKLVRAGDKVIFNTTVKNVGHDDVPHGTYDVDLYLDTTLISFDHGTSTIRSGGETSYSMSPGYHHWIAPNPGTYEARLVVDEHNTLPETDESNNVKSITIIVR